MVCPAEFLGVDVAPGPACEPNLRDCLERQKTTDAFKNEMCADYTAENRQSVRSAGKGGFCHGHGIIADLGAEYGCTSNFVLD